MPVERFKSREAYRKNLAYRHIHGIPMTAERVVVGGRSHKVDHSRETPARKRINSRQRRKVARRSVRRQESRR
jgi:sRNA-binding protein